MAGIAVPSGSGCSLADVGEWHGEWADQRRMDDARTTEAGASCWIVKTELTRSRRRYMNAAEIIPTGVISLPTEEEVERVIQPAHCTLKGIRV